MIWDFVTSHFYIIATSLLCFSAWQLLLLYLLRWRGERLAAKYVAWQNEAQAVETATHEARCASADEVADLPQGYPKISIVVPVSREAMELDELLPCLLEQDYAGWYEVVVANQGQEEQVSLLLERWAQRSARLRTTFVPATSRYIELRKLAITLGVKAARGEWVIVIGPTTVPSSSRWLQCYAENLTPDVDFVEGYVNYAPDGSGSGRRAIMERVRTLQSRLRAYEHGVVLGCELSNFALRRSWFMSVGGFAESLELPFGEEYIMACLHADAYRTAFLCAPDTRLTEILPSRSTLIARRVAEAECRRRLHGKQKWYWLADAVVAWCPCLFLLSNIVYSALRIVMDCRTGVYAADWLAFDVVAGLWWLVALFVPLLMPRRSMKALQERHPGLYIWLYDLMLPWRMVYIDLLCRMQRRHFVRRYIPMTC